MYGAILGDIVGSPCGFHQKAAEKPVKRPPMMRNGKKQRGICLNGRCPFCRQPLSGSCRIICFVKPVLRATACGAPFSLPNPDFPPFPLTNPRPLR